MELGQAPDKLRIYGDDVRGTGEGSLLHDGLAALADGRWDDACACLEKAADIADGDLEQAQAVDGLAEALWWLGRSADAVVARERAYLLHRRLGDIAEAARVAAWLSREYRGPLASPAAARGWLARAETLAGETGDPGVAGWLALGRAEQAVSPAEQQRHAEEAVRSARENGLPDLEILALARLGLARLRVGAVDAGARCFDEAMAAATGGEPERLSTLAEVYCLLVVATELEGDVDRFGEWSKVLARVSERRNLPMLLEFCECCQAEVAVGAGDVSGAEVHLKHALVRLEQAGLHARCFPPAAKLAELWILQDRLADAEQVLAGAHGDAMLLPRARLALARGDNGLAAALAARFVRRGGGDNASTAAGIAIVAESALAEVDLATVEAAVRRLETVAEASRHPRVAGLARLLRGRLLAAGGDPDGAAAAFEAALDALAGTPGTLDAGRAHLGLARLLDERHPTTAADEARAALDVFDSVGSRRDADEAAALLRKLGDHTRVGEKAVGVLSKREQDVLRLVAEGQSNAEIATRLFISTKTAGNHVSNILTKLGVRSRAEAAAWAVLNLRSGT